MANDQMPVQILDDECTVYSKYLIQQTPTPYVLAKYRQAHVTSPKLARHRPAAFDAMLVELSRKHTATTKLVDAYTALFFRNATVRKKMVLLLAILESSAPTYPVFDEPDAGGGKAFLFRFVMHGIIFAFAVIAAAIMFLPLHVGFELGNVLAPLPRRLAANWESFGASLPAERAQTNPSPPAPLPRGEGST